MMVKGKEEMKLGGGVKWEKHKPNYEWSPQISLGQLAVFSLVSLCSIAGYQSPSTPYYYGEFLGSSLVKVQGSGCLAPAHRASWPGKACGTGKGSWS